MKPIIGFIGGMLGFAFFPDKAHYYALMAVLGAAAIDVATKHYAIIVKHGGYRNAVRSGELFSKTLWKGAQTKIIAYLTISLLTGLSYRVIYLKEAGIALATFVYSMMFLREFESNIENLEEAGADLKWLRLFTRKKIKDQMKGLEDEEKRDDYEKRV